MYRRYFIFVAISICGNSLGCGSSVTDGSAIPEPEPQDMPVRMCIGPGAQPSDIVLAQVSAEGLYLVRADGSGLRADLQAPPAPPGAELAFSLLPWGERLVVTASFEHQAASSHAVGSVLSVVDRAGHTALSVAEPERLLVVKGFGSDGRIAATRHDASGLVDSVIIEMDGTLTSLGAVTVTGAPEGALVRGERTDSDGSTELGWLEIPGAALQPQVFGGFVMWSLPWGDTEYMSLSAGKSAPWLHHETASDASIAAILWDVDVEDPTTLEPVELHAAAWLLLRDSALGQLWRAGVASNEQHAVRIETGDGRWPLADDCGGQPASLDAEGHVVVAMRDAESAEVRLLDPALERWDPIGQRVSVVDAVGVEERWGTYVIHGRGADAQACGGWSPGDDALVGDSWQVVRPAAGVAHRLPADAGGVVVGAEGLCAAYDAGGATHVLDVLTGDVFTLETRGNATWLL